MRTRLLVSRAISGRSEGFTRNNGSLYRRFAATRPDEKRERTSGDRTNALGSEDRDIISRNLQTPRRLASPDLRSILRLSRETPLFQQNRRATQPGPSGSSCQRMLLRAQDGNADRLSLAPLRHGYPYPACFAHALRYPTSRSDASIRSLPPFVFTFPSKDISEFLPPPRRGVGGRERIRLAGKPRVSPGDGKVGRNGARKGRPGGRGRTPSAKCRRQAG